MLVLLTYHSESIPVTGYLYLPRATGVTLDDIRKQLQQTYGNNPFCEDSVIELASTYPAEPAATGIPELIRKLPLLIYCRGGTGGFGRVRPHWMEEFSQSEYAVFAPNYRGNEGGQGRDEFGGAEHQDVEAAIQLFRSFPWIDQERISIMGFSRGAIHAAKAAASPGLGIQGAVLWSGVSDLDSTYEERIDLRRTLKRMLGGSPSKVPEAYRERSAIHWAERIQCPILLIHGTEDQQVAYNQSEVFYQKLMHLGHPVTFHRYAGMGHLFPWKLHREASQRMMNWIRDQEPI